MRVVLKLGGNVVLDPIQVALVAREAQALQAQGCQVAIVHGGGPQLDAALLTLGETVQRIDGLRVTSITAAGVVREVMDRIGADLAARLSQHGTPSRHVASTEARLKATVKRHPLGSLGRVGTVASFDASDLHAAGGIPIVTPVGFDANGPLNVNADEGACAVAAAIGAEWLILGTDVTAVRGEGGQPIERLTTTGARRLVASSAATGGMVPKLGAATSALERGVRRVLITRVAPGSLVRAILEGHPEGTLVEADAGGLAA